MNWNLEYLYKSHEDFLKDFENVKNLCDKFKNYQGKLADEKMFVEYYSMQIELEEKLGKVYEYAALKSDLNKKDIDALSDLNSCQQLLFKLSQDTSFEEPEILSIGKDKVFKYLDNNKNLEELRFSFEKIFRKEKYILSEKEERILSLCLPSMENGRDLYSSLAVSDGVNKEVTLSNGEKEVVTQGNWSVLVADSKNSQDRKLIFETLYSKYDEHKNTFASIYANIMEANKAIKEAKGYSSILESYLYNNNIPTKVYETLVKVARTETEAVKKYLKLRKEYLGLEEYHTYDRFLSLASSTTKYTYEEAKDIFFKSLEKFPKDFQEKAHMALEEGFVDVYEKEGKRTGAYSSSQANIRPFILLNYSNTLDDVFTVAHEAGHSIHSLYSMQNPVTLQSYTIFVAEIASTFNEHNLLDYLMSTGNLTNDDKISLLQKAIDNIMATFYRQTLFADYELTVSRLAENGQPINHKVLSDIMIDLYEKYYGLDIEKENVKKYVWAYIPHLFYTPFYVYQYATSFSASFKIYDDVKNGKENAFEKYIGLLKAGGTKYPVEEALDAGVDFTKEETFKAVTNRMKELVDELESLLKNK